MEDMNRFIGQFIVQRMSHLEYNNMGERDEFAFDTPLVGFSRADDPLYAYYKQHIDPDFYRLPQEWLEARYGRTFDPSRVSVVSWFLPQTAANREKSRSLRECASHEWQLVYSYGQACNAALAGALEETLCGMGFEAVAPMCSPQFSWGQSERFYKISNWSERHTALISGLGTFGRCDALISARGKAGRYGSVIVHCPLEPTKRAYTRYNEYCLADRGCTACIRRCPAGAISQAGHDKRKCEEYLERVVVPLCHDRYGYDGESVCGLCQTGVPCEACIPEKARMMGT